MTSHAAPLLPTIARPGDPPPGHPRHRPLALFLGLNAVAAFAGAAGLATGAIGLGADLTTRLPFDSPVVGGLGLVLAVGLPLGLAAAAAWHGDAETADLLVGAGVLLVLWIVVQLAVIRAFSPFQPFYTGVGAALVATGERMHRVDRAAPPARPRSHLVSVLRCAVAVAGHLARHRLRLRPDRVGSTATLPDGRAFTVFRESLRRPDREVRDPVVLAVWFHLRVVPAGSERRRRAFQRACLVNTLLFAGFEGFVAKRWLVDEATADWAGLYVWDTDDAAHRYARYVTAVLGPLSTPGSVGYEVTTPAAARTARPT